MLQTCIMCFATPTSINLFPISASNKAQAMVIPQQKWSFSVILVYNLFAFIPEITDSMTLCEYYSNLGIYKPECHPVYLTHNNVEEDEESYPQYQQQTSFDSPFQFNSHEQQQLSPFHFSFHRTPSHHFGENQHQFALNQYKSAENRHNSGEDKYRSSESQYKSSENQYKASEHRYKSAENEVEVLPEYEEYGLCTRFFHMCYDSDKCESGTICSQLSTTKQCCTDPRSTCPTPTELGFNCRKINPTSW